MAATVGVVVGLLETLILKAYLKTQRAPKGAIEALEDLTVDQHKAWKIAVGKIKKALGE